MFYYNKCLTVIVKAIKFNLFSPCFRALVRFPSGNFMFKSLSQLTSIFVVTC